MTVKRDISRVFTPRRNRLLLFIKKRILACFVILIIALILLFMFILFVYSQSDRGKRAGNFQEVEFEWKDMENISSRNCEHYHQGRQHLSVDDLGNICEINHIRRNGCCDEKYILKRFHCNVCNKNGCCAEYEDCVSCCLHPKNENNLRNILKHPLKHFKQIMKKLRNQFELCLAKCRTSSESVIHQKIYKNSKNKYCFKQLEEFISLDLDKDLISPV